MDNRLGILLLYGATLSISFADMSPTLIDPNNPAKAARPVALPPVGQKTPQVSVAPPAPQLTPQTPVTVKHLQFIGGTRYPLDSLVEPFRPLVGKTVPLSQLLALTNGITQRYQQDGLPLSYAYLPSDNFHDGTVRIVLVEGYIAHSNINSDNASTSERLSRLSALMMEEKPLSQATFDRYSLLMQRTPATKVEANAALPNNIYGAADMKIDATQPHIWNLSSTIDTRKGSNLALVNGTLSNLTSYGDQLGLATLIPLDNGTRKTYFGANYQQYLTDNGLLMQLKGSFYREDPRDFTPLLYLPQDIAIEAREKTTQYTGGIAFSYPLLLERKKQFSVSGGLDYIDKRDDYALRASRFENSIDLPSVSQRTRYPAAEFSAWGYREYEKTNWSTRLTLRKGIDGFGASTTPGSGTNLNFTRWKANGDAAWMVAERWKLSTSLEGDWSNNNLPEAERVSFGAQRYGRGYPDGEASGDYGYGGQVELRYLHNLEKGVWLNTVQPYVVADTAQTWFNQQGFRHQRLASVATGVTVGDSRHYSVSVEAARPLADLPSDSSRRDWRFSLTFTYNFNNLH
ncbi:ShlB/FhaC/HecB family hemolysin secretion/activation protein [Cedecea sp. FDAARGOS_727]|uniref:ShlB/FhaC/HecB family hemolysin secretion/activation protein n=1 Tax=Cedecea sp. FDAARGOS_727 TaxID=2545798 RepID=UPI00143EE959|nr:ShlB/FhaC/HecB family hemolysin secretion/activation protein [Cedecea sp. FDAARGOS_727]QIX98099.1 ShlB/FhaC/HecB family hemolysin secretion/activation protein [Cedecea sp. FDAARGOS_727]